MANFNRKLLSAVSPAASPYPSSNGLNCQFVENCSSDASVPCFECFSNDVLSPPSPPPPVRENSFQNHIVPYLITLVCVLGVAFLILTTCTVLLRHRWNRRRNSRRVTTNPDDGFNDGDLGPIDHPIWHIATIGLQQSVIDSITTFKYEKYQGLLSDTSECSVCLTEFEDGDDLRLLPKCSHAFHMPGIDTWLRSHTNCPICRAPIVSEVSVVPSFEGTGYVVFGSSRSDSVSNESGSSQSQRLEDERSNSGRSDHGRGPSGRHGGESSCQIREKGDGLQIQDITTDENLKKQREQYLRVRSDFGVLKMGGIKMDEILKQQREDLRAYSDLGVNHYRSWMGEDLEPIKRSLSFDYSLNICLLKGEGSSSSKQRKGVDLGKDAAGKQQVQGSNDEDDGRNGSSSNESMKNPSFGRLLQKGPVSMKRSISSSSGKFFSSFRKSKSQATVLPL